MSSALFLAHEDDRQRGRTEAGSLAAIVADRGFDVAIAHPHDDVPDPADVDALVVLGSIESAYDDVVPWVEAEAAYLRRAVQARTPVLGICFGAQLASRVLGGVVESAPIPELGFVAVDPVLDIDGVEGVDGSLESGPWMQWHFDRFTLPPGATLLARNHAGVQAFLADRVLGVQFHPEIDSGSFAAWRAGWSPTREAEIDADLGVDVDAVAQRIVDDEDELAARCARLFDRFCAITA